MFKQLKRQSVFQQFQGISSRTIALMIVSVGVLTTLGLVLADRKITFDREEQLATESLYRMRASLEEAFHKRLTLLVSLEAFVKSHPDLDLTNPSENQSFQNYFERFTDSLDQQVRAHRAIQGRY